MSAAGVYEYVIVSKHDAEGEDLKVPEITGPYATWAESEQQAREVAAAHATNEEIDVRTVTILVRRWA